MRSVAKKAESMQSLSLGIDVVEAKNQIDVDLPDFCRIPPTEIAEQNNFSLLYPVKSIDIYIFERLFPSLIESDIFIPSNFRRCLAEIRESLRIYAGKHPGSAKIFGKLASLLDEDRSLIDLLEVYRLALIKG